MIHVHNLNKYYGDDWAVRDLSFDVPRGQITGFLGPNGAGKTTTMRILAGYLTATSGRARVAGFDVFWEPLEVRRHIGYLPESCPLYPEMRVIEYLRFRGGIKGLHGRERSRRIDLVLDRCWLRDVQRQLIGTLSKGYRQRVGLADALLADPPVLILDEPTTGLDPTQIRAARDMIRELRHQHTILLSTHILSEVEVTCDHVIMLHRGEIAARGPLADLVRFAGKQQLLIVETIGDVDPTPVHHLPGVQRLETERLSDGLRLRVFLDGKKEVAPLLCEMASTKGWKVRELRQQRRSLEDLFVETVERN